MSSLSPYNTRKVNNLLIQPIYDVKVESSEKDILISQLKAQIFELEQNEKNFQGLNQKFKSLQNEFSLLSDEKLKLEYEFKQRNESTSKQLNELRVEFENLQQNFSDKVVQNKRLYAELNTLEKTLNSKVDEIQNLRAQLNECMDRNARLNDEKMELEEIINNLKEIKHRNQGELEDLFQENERLKKTNIEQERRVKKLDSEKEKLLVSIDNLNYENSNLISKIKSREENLHTNQRILEETKVKNLQYIDNLKDLEIQLENYRIELDGIKSSKAKETRVRVELEKINQDLDRSIREKERDLKALLDELNHHRITNDKLMEDNEKLFNELEKLKHHIFILSDQNQKLTEELDIIAEQDDRIKAHLNRRERILNLKKSNQFYLEKSLNNIDDYRNNRIHTSPQLKK